MIDTFHCLGNSSLFQIVPISLWISERIVVLPALISCSAIWSVSGDLCLFIFQQPSEPHRHWGYDLVASMGSGTCNFSYIKFDPNMLRNVDSRLEINVLPSVKYRYHSADFTNSRLLDKLKKNFSAEFHDSPGSGLAADRQRDRLTDRGTD
jgi:hypothetical protein